MKFFPPIPNEKTPILQTKEQKFSYIIKSIADSKKEKPLLSDAEPEPTDKCKCSIQ